MSSVSDDKTSRRKIARQAGNQHIERIEATGGRTDDDNMPIRRRVYSYGLGPVRLPLRLEKLNHLMAI